MSNFVITKATLYRLGVGWFTAESNVDSENVFFPLSTKSLNDFLKTVVIKVEPSSEYVQNISFDTQENISDFFDSNRGLTGLLEFLRGKKVKINYYKNLPKNTKSNSSPTLLEAKGIVIGFETDIEEEYRESTPPFGVITLYDENQKKILVIPLKEILFIYLLEEKTHSQLLDHLFIAGGSFEAEKEVIVRIHLSSNNAKKLKIHFLSEVPAWKITYRIHLLDQKEEKNQDENKLLIETWGIVDNKTQMDWVNCSLELSTETPVSFQYDLSTPHYITRPTIERETSVDFSLRPEEFERFEGEFPEVSAPENFAMAAPRSAPMAKKAFETQKKYQPPPEQATATAKLGESVTYHLSSPVTIKKGQSSMVPLKHETIPGKEELLFDEEKHKIHPFKVIFLKNSLSYALDKAPLSIFKEQKFLGETMLPRISSGEETHIPFALEKNITIKHEIKTFTQRIALGIEKQYQYQVNKTIQEHSWKIKNKTKKKYSLKIKLPKNKGFIMENKTNKDKETQTEWLISVILPPNKTIEVKRTISKEYKVTYYINDLTPQQLEEFLKHSKIDEKTKKIIKELQALKLKKIEIKNEISGLEITLKKLEKHYQKILETLKVIQDNHEEQKYRQKYLKEMDEIKTKIEKTANILQHKEEELNRLEKEIREILSNFPISTF